MSTALPSKQAVITKPPSEAVSSKPDRPQRQRKGPPGGARRRERLLAIVLLLPAFLMLALFVAYPFMRGIWLSLTNAVVGMGGKFIGLGNYAVLWHDDIFREAAANTFIYTLVATAFKLTLGMGTALLLNTLTRLKRLISATLLLPFIVPTVLSALAWKWMLDPTFSVVNWALGHLGFMVEPIDWLGSPGTALVSIIIVNVWRGFPFFAITLLAGLQTINPDVEEAASLDGANAWQRFWHIIWPLLLPVTMVVVLFSVIQTFADFQLVYILTGGGPANSTQLFSIYAYQLAIQTGEIGKGAAVSLAMFPFLFLAVVFQLWYIRRGEGREGV